MDYLVGISVFMMCVMGILCVVAASIDGEDE